MPLARLARLATVLTGTALLLAQAGGSAAAPATGHHKTYFAESHQASEAKIRPKLTFVSGDSTLWITHSTWSKWNANQAVGTGVSHVNNCDPSCAGGHVYKDPVHVTLSRPRQHCGKTFFTRLVMRWPGRKPPKADRFPHQSLTPIICQQS